LSEENLDKVLRISLAKQTEMQEEEKDALCQVVFDNFSFVAEMDAYSGCLSNSILALAPSLESAVVERALEKGMMRNAAAVSWSLKQTHSFSNQEALLVPIRKYVGPQAEFDEIAGSFLADQFKDPSFKNNKLSKLVKTMIKKASNELA
jgi:hypothetical protein